MMKETVLDKLGRISRQGYPTTACIEVTTRCNARCEYCFLCDESPHADLATDRLCFAMEKFSKAGAIHLHLTGGEPFLRPDMLTLLSFAFEHGFFYCTLFSNGTLLDKTHLDYIVRNRNFFRTMQFSVFSHVPEINDSYFGVSGALDTVMKNALYLKENGVRVSIALTILDFNLETMEETRAFLENHGLPSSPACFKTVAGPRLADLLAKSTDYSFFKRYLQLLRPDEIEEYKRQMKESLELPMQYDNELCIGRWESIFMNAEGDLAPCLSFRNVKYGNIFEERAIHDILQQSPDYHAICSTKKRDMKKCRTCRFLNFCFMCLGNIHTRHNSLFATDVQMCNFAQALYDITF
jgi:radical SAM protein with 4Fe4S-binding SPASM domain